MVVIEMNEANDTLFAEVPSREEARKERQKENARIWFQNNKARKYEKRKEWRLNNKDKERAYGIKRRIRDGARLDKINKEWREKNKEYILQKKKEYDKANPDKVRSYCRNRRARIANSEGSHTTEDISNLFELQKGKCALCKKSIKRGYHVDHNIPLARGGTNDKYNLQLLCAPCNVRKSARDPIEHNQSLGLLL